MNKDLAGAVQHRPSQPKLMRRHVYEGPVTNALHPPSNDDAPGFRIHAKPRRGRMSWDRPCRYSSRWGVAWPFPGPSAVGNGRRAHRDVSSVSWKGPGNTAPPAPNLTPLPQHSPERPTPTRFCTLLRRRPCMGLWVFEAYRLFRKGCTHSDKSCPDTTRAQSQPGGISPARLRSSSGLIEKRTRASRSASSGRSENQSRESPRSPASSHQ